MENDVVWVSLPSPHSGYEISEMGIRNKKTMKLLKGNKTGGYHKYFLSREGGGMHGVYFHRLLASSFIPNEKNYPIIDHIDRNKLNNSLSNLRWVNHSMNALNVNVTGCLFVRKTQRPKMFGFTWRDGGVQKTKFFLTSEEANAFRLSMCDEKGFIRRDENGRCIQPKISSNE